MKEFTFPVHPVSRKEAIVKGNGYRITVLTDSLLRLEYNEDNCFEDRATQTVVDRDFEVPEYVIEKRDGKLFLETAELELIYDEKPFSEQGLCIRVKAIEDATWHYGQQLKDLKGTYRTLDRADGNYNVRTGRKIELEQGVLSREGFSVIDDSKSMALNEEGWIETREKAQDIYFFGYGHRYLECLRDFYHLCGNMPLLPKYALGNWWSRYHAYTESEYKALIERFEAEELPFTVSVIDIDWHLRDIDPKYGSGWTGYTWNRDLFPQPEAFLAWLHEKGLKVSLNVHPADGIRAFEEVYPKVAEAMGIDPSSEETVEFDCTDPKFMEVYFDVLSHDLERQGVDFWWLDWQQGTESKIPGLDPLWILNHYHYLDSTWKGNRALTFSRYAGVGSHRYPIGFSGDTYITWESLAYQPYFTNTASNIGFGWWSHDIGGFMRGIRDDELMARWIQYGVFSPINRLHCAYHTFIRKEPWNYSAVTREIMNRFLRLRHSMIPYLYTMNRRASKDALPLIQPMYYSEPEREEAYQVPNEYWFGSELIVSPITEPTDKIACAGKAKTWLPKGMWVDFFTGMVYQGDKMINLWRELGNIPVLMKEGAIVPMRESSQHNNSLDNPEAMEVHVFPASNGTFTMWEDTGDTPEDKDENWASTLFTMEKGEKNCFTIHKAQGNLSVIPEQRSWKIVFRAVENAVPVVITGMKQISLETTYVESTHSLIVTIPAVSVQEEIKVCFKEGLEVVSNSLEERCHPILMRAQMNYLLKEELWEAIKQSKEAAETECCLKETMIAESVIDSLREVFTA